MKRYKFKDTEKKFRSNGILVFVITILLPLMYFLFDRVHCYVILAIAIIEISLIAHLLWKLRPIKIESIRSFEYRWMPFKRLDDFADSFIRVGICGPPNVGKTTLVNSLTLTKPANDRTNQTQALVARSKVSGKDYVLIDGKGQRHNDQFNIAKNTDPLIILLDHNISHNVTTIDQSRLNKTFLFVEQIRMSLESDKIYPKRVLIVLNKKDLWSKNSQQVQKQLMDWRIKIKQNWLSYLGGRSNITLHQISSYDTMDIINLLESLNL